MNKIKVMMRLSRGLLTVSYTSGRRPLSISKSGNTASFAYNHAGQRTKMAVTGTSANYIRTYLGGNYEREERGITTERLYLGGSPYSAPAVAIRTGVEAWQIHYIHRDYLGSIVAVSNAAGAPVESNSYDAWGRLRNAQSIQPYGKDAQPTLLLNRGYTGHEHLPEFGLINMNARLYDPVLGRFLSPDPFVQAPDFSQSFNRYSYAWNNPMVYTDPSGEFLWLIAAAAAYTLFFTDVGYDIQKYVLPAAVKFEVHPFSSDERFFGAKISVGVPQILPASYRWEWGANYYTRFYDTGWQGWETTYGEEFGLLGRYTASFTEYTMHGMEDFNQTVLKLKWGYPGFNASYYNDYIHEDKFKFFRKLTPYRIIGKGDDKQDRWRTAAVHLQLGPLSWGTKVITGDPGPYGERKTYKVGDQEYYQAHGEYDPGKYSHGIEYIGIGPFRIGKNTEANRDQWQNEFAHRKLGIPFFPRVDRPDRWYWFW